MIKRKCAIILRGHMRTYAVTAKSLILNIAEPNDADIFIFTYKNNGVSSIPSLYSNDSHAINKFKESIEYEKQDMQGDIITYDSLYKYYGSYLKAYQIVEYDDLLRSKLNIDSKHALDIGINKQRSYGMYYSTTEAYRMFLNYCKNNDIRYEYVILSRPDLNFYSKLIVDKFNPKYIYIPKSGGNINMSQYSDSYKVMSYKNVYLMEYIEYEKYIFNDQFIVSSQTNMNVIESFYDNLDKYLERGIVTSHPETVLFYHLVYLNKKIVKFIRNFDYEILRNNFNPIDNLILSIKNQKSKNYDNKYNKKLKKHIARVIFPIKQILKIVNIPFLYIIDVFAVIFYFFMSTFRN